MDQCLVIIGGEVEATALMVGKATQQRFGQFNGPMQIGTAPAGLQQLQQAGEQVGMVIQIRGELRVTTGLHRIQTPVTPGFTA